MNRYAYRLVCTAWLLLALVGAALAYTPLSPIPSGTSANAFAAEIDALLNGTSPIDPLADWLKLTQYSAAGTPAPTCDSTHNGAYITVSDQTNTCGGPYVSGGSLKCLARCDSGTGWLITGAPNVIRASDFGAVGNDSTDDTTALTNAEAAAEAYAAANPVIASGWARQGIVTLDPGKTYKISGNGLTINAGRVGWNFNGACIDARTVTGTHSAITINSATNSYGSGDFDHLCVFGSGQASNTIGVMLAANHVHLKQPNISSFQTCEGIGDNAYTDDHIGGEIFNCGTAVDSCEQTNTNKGEGIEYNSTNIFNSTLAMHGGCNAGGSATAFYLHHVHLDGISGTVIKNENSSFDATDSYIETFGVTAANLLINGNASSNQYTYIRWLGGQIQADSVTNPNVTAVIYNNSTNTAGYGTQPWVLFDGVALKGFLPSASCVNGSGDTCITGNEALYVFLKNITTLDGLVDTPSLGGDHFGYSPNQIPVCSANINAGQHWTVAQVPACVPGATMDAALGGTHVCDVFCDGSRIVVESAGASMGGGTAGQVYTSQGAGNAGAYQSQPFPVEFSISGASVAAEVWPLICPFNLTFPVNFTGSYPDFTPGVSCGRAPSTGDTYTVRVAGNTIGTVALTAAAVPAYVQDKSALGTTAGNTTTSPTISIALTNSVGAGHALVAVINSNSLASYVGDGTTAIADTNGGTPDTFTCCPSNGVRDGTSSNALTQICYALNVAGGTTTVKFGASATESYYMDVSEFSNIATSGAQDVCGTGGNSAGTTGGTTTPVSTGSITTTNTFDLVIASGVLSTGGTISSGPTNSFTGIGLSPNTQGGITGMAAYYIATSTGTFNPTWTMSTTGYWAGEQLALKSPAGGCVPTFATTTSNASCGGGAGLASGVCKCTAGQRLELDAPSTVYNEADLAIALPSHTP